MKVTLINPLQSTGYPQPPLGLALIAAVLEREGFIVELIDANALKLRPGQVAALLLDTDIIGLTAMTPTITGAAEIARQVKKIKRGSTIILGGTHGTLMPAETLSAIPEIDIVVRGEGELTAVELLRGLRSKHPLAEIQGISYRSEGQIYHTDSRDLIDDLDSLPFLAYHMLPLHKYKPHPPHGRAYPFATIITSRGCPYRCSYCSKPIFGSIFRAQSPERVIDEISYYMSKFGVREIAFYDDVLTLDKKRIHAISDGILKIGRKLNWTCESRVNLVDREILRHMKAAGCYAIAYGIESASQEILDAIHKGIKPEQVIEAIRMTREAGMQTIGYFMIGSPGETRDTINATIEFAKSLKLDFVQFSITTPLPGSELYKIYRESGRADVPWESYVYESTSDIETPVFESANLKRADLRYFRAQAYKRFYLRFSYVWQRIRRMTSFGDLMINIKGLIMLLQDITPGRLR